MAELADLGLGPVQLLTSCLTLGNWHSLSRIPSLHLQRLLKGPFSQGGCNNEVKKKPDLNV